MLNFWKKLKILNNKINNINSIINESKARSNFITNNLKNDKVLIGKLLSKLHSEVDGIKSLKEVEFQVFSQWGDDGIIQYLIRKLEINNKTFIEFGVENYLESNTRYLLINNCWTGFVMDGNNKNIEFIKSDSISWSNQLYAKTAFITKDNINSLIMGGPFKDEVGILSIDIDGNDYWVWESINVVSPIIIIIEYNSLFGRYHHWAIPYTEDFVRGDIYSPEISYYGVSLQAAVELGKRKGYSFVGCNSNGNNAYFIRDDYSSRVSNLITTAEQAFVLCSFNEMFTGTERVLGPQRIKNLNGKTIVNTLTGLEEKIKFSNEDIKLHHY